MQFYFSFDIPLRDKFRKYEQMEAVFSKREE